MGSRLWAGAAAAAGLLALAGPAGATVFTATFTGTVRNGTDYEGVFGAAGDLTGEAFTAVFRIDDATPGASFDEHPGGSSIFGFEPGVPVTASISIKGVTRIYGEHYGGASAYDASDGAYDQVLYSAQDLEESEGGDIADDSYFYLLLENQIAFYASSVLDDFTAGDVRAPFTYALGPNTIMDGSFQEYRSRYFEGQGKVSHYLVQADLSPTLLTVAMEGAPNAPVPEPATWAMLVLGLGAAGAMIRRRRRAAWGACA